MIRIIYILALCGLSLTVQAQGLGLHFMDDVWQQNYTNPALVPQQRFFFSFPSFYAGLSTNTSASENLFILDGSTLTSNFNNYIDNIDNDLFVRTDIGFEPLAFGFKTKNIHWTFNSAVRSFVHVSTNSTKDLFNLILNGNEAFIGQTAVVDPEGKFGIYQEYGLGASIGFTSLLNIGVRAKYLVGMGAVETTNSRLSLTTADEYYQLSFDGDIGVNIAGAPQFIDIDSTAGELEFNAFPNNRGFALDLGATFQIGDKFRVTASILDLGGITWSENTQNVRVQGQFDFDGVDIAGYILGNETEIPNPLDSLEDSYSFASNQGGFNTSLSPKLYVSGMMYLEGGFKLGLIIRNEFTDLGVLTGFGVNIQKQFGKVLGLGLMYSVQNGTYTNVGANLSLKLGPIQVFAVSDNLLVALNPLAGSNANIRTGLNIALNEKDDYDE